MKPKANCSLNQQCFQIDVFHLANIHQSCMNTSRGSNYNARNQTEGMKAKGGILLVDKGNILKRWSDYIEELFHDNRGEKLEIHWIIMCQGTSKGKREVTVANILKKNK